MKKFGILNVDKPSGLSSRAAVNSVQRIVRPTKLGHAGTLDPMASGVLLVCLGPATRLVPRIHEFSKSYRGRFVMGQRSNTDDATGEIETVTSNVSHLQRSDIESKLQSFVGEIEQVPPQFSAVKIDGKRAYKLARRGKDLEIRPKQVVVHHIKLTEFSLPEIELEIECGSGTYIRSIGRDLGEALGCGALMSQLIRTRIGEFRIDDSVAPDSLTAENIDQHIQPAQSAVADLPTAIAGVAEIEDIRCGRVLAIRRVECSRQFSDTELIALLDSNRELAALMNYRHNDQSLAPKQVYVTD